MKNDVQIWLDVIFAVGGKWMLLVRPCVYEGT